jgi:flagellin
MSVINTNVNSLVAQNAATVNSRSLSKAMEQLSTGKRINSAADDAAGSAISNKITAQIRGLNQAVRNANDGISMIQTAEGATKEVTNMLQRMRELAVQSANSTNTTDDRTYLQTEITELQSEIGRISNNTQWNGMNISGGTNGMTALSAGATFQVGANADQVITVEFKSINLLGGVVSAIAATAATVTSANAAITSIDIALKDVDTYRATLGAKINRLTYAADNLSNVSINASESRSRILDTDYAKTTTDLAKAQIIQQAATAMLAQANQAPQSVLSLLR